MVSRTRVAAARAMAVFSAISLVAFSAREGSSTSR